MALPYLSWGLSMTIFIPVILGLLLFGPLCVSCRHNTWQLCSLHNFAMRSRLGDERPPMFADMTVIVEGIATVVEQRYDLYSWYVLLVDGGTVEPLTNDHPHQRPSLSYDHISCDGQWFLFVYESLTSDHPSYTTTPM